MMLIRVPFFVDLVDYINGWHIGPQITCL